MKNLFIILLGILIGVASVIFSFEYYGRNSQTFNHLLSPLGLAKPEVIGFLPYWLMGEKKDYSEYLTQINYFGLTVDADGTVQKFTNPGETEPGWLALKKFKEDKLRKSLVIFSADQDKIGQLMDNPVEHATKLVEEISPIIKDYGFADVNLDIESVSVASESARQSFTLFTKTVHDLLKVKNKDVTLSLDVSPTALLKPYLIDVAAIAPYVQKVIFMTYDFHYQGSSVTGAVSPVGGGGITAEFDTEVSIKEALRILPPEKVVLGAPLYGYEWETLSDKPRAGVIPGSGITASAKRVEEILEKCTTCSAQYDEVDQEANVIYRDQDTGTYHQIYYPDKRSMQAKIDLVKKYKLGGLALWAMGYEGKEILEPLKSL